MNNISLESKASFYLNVALMATAFSIAAMIWKEQYLIYGFITFIYGLIGHVIDNFVNLLYGKEKNGKFYLEKEFREKIGIINIVLFVAWLATILIIYI